MTSKNEYPAGAITSANELKELLDLAKSSSSDITLWEVDTKYSQKLWRYIIKEANSFDGTQLLGVRLTNGSVPSEGSIVVFCPYGIYDPHDSRRLFQFKNYWFAYAYYRQVKSRERVA